MNNINLPPGNSEFAGERKNPTDRAERGKTEVRSECLTAALQGTLILPSGGFVVKKKSYHEDGIIFHST